MMRALLAVRFRALFSGMTRQARQKGRNSVGTTVLFAFLYLYVGVVILGMMGVMFYSLAQPYHSLGLDWLYFTMAGLMGLGFAVMGSVFSTQSQLYDAKDNELLLSMPVKPWQILLSRMIPLLALNLLFSGLVMGPAMVVYAVFVKFSPLALLLQLLGLAGITVLSQAIACLFGWLLHLMLSRMNKSFASVLYLVIFLGIYFYVYSNASSLLNTMVTNGNVIADTLHTWVWPLYALGTGCTGNILLMLAFLLIAAVLFVIVYRILSATFFHTALSAGKRSRKYSGKRTLETAASPAGAIIRKEWRKFLSCPVYLTNMGLGILMTAALTVAGILFRSKLMTFLELPELAELFANLIPLLICGMLAFLISTMCISTPSVSLEGKNLWILKSMPLTGKQILLAKLRFHILATVPVSAVSALILAAVYGCKLPDVIFCAAVCGLLALLNGIIGLLAGLKWAKFDYISEAYPCKQSVAVMVAMFSMMGIPAVFGILYFALLADVLSVTLFLGFSTLLLAIISWGFWRLLVTWGIRKWDSL